MADEPNVDGDNSNNTQSNARRLVVALLAVVVVASVIAIVVVATKGDDATSPTTTEPPSTATTLSSADQKVLADYRAFWDAYLQASDPMRPDHPALAAHSTGDEYALLVNSFSGAKASNVVFRGTIDTNAKVVSVDKDRATVRDCIDDKTGSYDATTGERKDVDDPQRHLSDATLQLVGGTWKVSGLENKGSGCTSP